MLRHLLSLWLAVIVCGAIGWLPARAASSPQDTGPTPAPTAISASVDTLPGLPVTVGGQTLFYVRNGKGEMTAAERAIEISNRIQSRATNPFLPTYQITVADSNDGSSIYLGDELLVTITQEDARANGMSQDEASQAAAAAIDASVTSLHSERSVGGLARAALLNLLVMGILVLLLWLIQRLYDRAIRWVDERPATTTRFPRFTGTKLYQSGRWKRLAKGGLNLLRWGATIVVLLIGIPIVLQGFRATEDVAEQALHLVLTPISLFWDWFTHYTDELITILLITGGAYILIRLVRWFFGEVERGGLRFQNADPTRARFTAGIISTLIAIGAAVMIFPYLPGANSDAFRAVVIFFGALLTFASTSAIANTVSGILLVYTDSFTIGEFIQVGQEQGKVMQQHVLTTELRTIRNEMISIPNSVVLNSYVTNFSRLGKDEGLIIRTTVTVGYDVPWRQVHALLIEAARATESVLEKPPPTVTQAALNDYNVTYELNCATRKLEALLTTFSDLHESIQDTFNEAGVELLSPAYTALRDGNTIAVPPEHRPEGYQPPGIRVQK